MTLSRRSFVGLLGCAGIAIPLLPQAIGTNHAPLIPETPGVKDALSQLQIGLPRPTPDRWFNARSLDGRPVKIAAVDLGDVLIATDANGQTYGAYTTYFECEGRYGFSATDKDLLDLSIVKDKAQFRMREDFAFIEAMGVDPESIEFI